MKLQKLFIFATMIFAALAAMTNAVSAQKKNAPNGNRNRMIFNTYQTVTEERSASAAKFSCQSPGVYATAKFTMPVDLSDGFYVTLATAGEVIIQHKMTVEVAPRQIRSIMVDLVPDWNADLGFPDATLDYSRKLLTELNPGVHKITVAVSVGEGNDEQIAAGEFVFDNRRGCEERYARVENLINGDAPDDGGHGDDAPETVEEDAPPVRPQTPKSEPQKTVQNGRVKFINNCSEDRSFDFWLGTQFRYGAIISAGGERVTDLEVGTKIFLRTANGDKLVHTVQPGAGEDGWGQQVATCQ